MLFVLNREKNIETGKINNKLTFQFVTCTYTNISLRLYLYIKYMLRRNNIQLFKAKSVDEVTFNIILEGRTTYFEGFKISAWKQKEFDSTFFLYFYSSIK